jgi:hypothetical protein
VWAVRENGGGDSWIMLLEWFTRWKVKNSVCELEKRWLNGSRRLESVRDRNNVQDCSQRGQNGVETFIANWERESGKYHALV